MKKLGTYCLLVAVLAVPGMAAPSYLGPSGNILTPDALTVPQGSLSVGYHSIQDLNVGGGDSDLNVWHGHFGLLPNVEVGISGVDTENDNEVAINGKWRFVDETATKPAVAVGVIDLLGNALDDDPTLYILVSKNLTRTATEVAGESKPLVGTLGFGSGFYDGLFAGLDWTYNPKLSVMAEYLSGGSALDEDNMVNFGLRYAATKDLRLDVSWVDFDSIGFGASYALRF